jgi:formylglycine-generating enzyme required for sulfatase activity
VMVPTPLRRELVAVALSVLASAACSGGANSDLDPGPLQTEGDASVDQAIPGDAQHPDGPVSTGECKRAAALPGPRMVAVPTPDGSTYCIDSTEVTQGDYEEFIEAKGGTMGGVPADMSGQPVECEFNTRYTAAHPDDIPAACRWTFEAFDSTGGHPDYPVGCVDWCDAFMYCQWAGKRLCGAIGGGTISWEREADAWFAEWYNACSQGGTTVYPYGDEFDAVLCGGGESTEAAPAPLENHPAAETPACHGSVSPFDQVLNMSGNLAEWTDSCQSSMNDGTCHVQGRSGYPPTPERFACDATQEVTRSVKEPDIGIRCCLD